MVKFDHRIVPRNTHCAKPALFRGKMQYLHERRGPFQHPHGVFTQMKGFRPRHFFIMQALHIAQPLLRQLFCHALKNRLLDLLLPLRNRRRFRRNHHLGRYPLLLRIYVKRFAHILFSLPSRITEVFVLSSLSWPESRWHPVYTSRLPRGAPQGFCATPAQTQPEDRC